MRRYRLLSNIVLSFLLEGEQRDFILSPDEGGALESDGQTVWYINKHGRHESITTANIIGVTVAQGLIEEVSS